MVGLLGVFGTTDVLVRRVAVFPICLFVHMEIRWRIMVQTLQKLWRRSHDQAKEWAQAYGRKFLLSLGLIAVIALAFEGGFVMGRDRQVPPVLVEQPAESCPSLPSEPATQESQSPTQAPSAENSTDKGSMAPTATHSQTSDTTCAFVGSRNSNKYHLPQCSWAKRIKPENRVCFTSAADAEAKGYQPGCVK